LLAAAKYSMFGWGSQAEDESVPFPKTEEEFKEVARECLDNLVELYNQSEADGWTRINFTATYGEPDVELFEKPSTFSPINTLKVYGSVPCTPEVVFLQSDTNPPLFFNHG